jgi:malic enzyme
VPRGWISLLAHQAILYKHLGGLDAFPIRLDTKDPDGIIRTVELLQLSFGGVTPEDISQPKCCYILAFQKGLQRTDSTSKLLQLRSASDSGWLD